MVCHATVMDASRAGIRVGQIMLVRHLVAVAFCCIATPVAFAQIATPPVIDLPLSSFFKRPVGPRGLELSDELRNAEGRVVRLVGYMVAREDATPGRFQIAPRPVRMSEHADGDADDLPPATVTVLLDPSQAHRVVVHRAGPLTLQGRLQVGRFEDAGGRVSWFRLQLDPQALAADRSWPTAAAAHGTP
jgi:hypothetical protein